MLAPIALGFPVASGADVPPAEQRAVETFANETSFGARAAALRLTLPIQQPGTGGVARVRLEDATSTRGALLDTVLAGVDFASPADLVTFARTHLSLSLSDFARAVGVERPTVYAWLSDSSTPTSASWSRLQDLGRLALQWYLRTGKRLGAMASIPLPSGGTLREMLVDPATPPRAIESVLDSLAARQESAGGVERRFAPLRVRNEIANSQNSVDSLAGKAFAEEDL